MKKRTKEEEREYKRILRARKVVPPAGIFVPPTGNIVPPCPTQCQGCLERDREIVKLKLRISVLEVGIKQSKNGGRDKSPVVGSESYPRPKANQSWRRG